MRREHQVSLLLLSYWQLERRRVLFTGPRLSSLDTALGKCHKTTSPKTPSLALAVAPLTVSGTVAASVMTGKFILILVRAIRVTTCFVYRRRRRRAPRARSPLASVVQRYSRGRFGKCAYGR